MSDTNRGPAPLRIVRRASADPTAVAGDAAPTLGGLHPVLSRAYLARGIRSESELSLSLERLLPVGTLDGVAAAVELLLAHRQRRILVVGDFDADQPTAQRQAEGLEVGEMIGRYRTRRVGGVAGRTLARIVLGPDREHERSPEGMGRPEQGADIHGLARPFDSDAEIAFHDRAFCCTNPLRALLSPG